MFIDKPYITFGAEKIPFVLRSKKKESNSITIKVQPSCQVVVLAPSSATIAEIMIAVNKRAQWVYNKIRGFEVQQAYIAPRQYISGESHYYLGKKYMLKIIDDFNLKPQVKLLRGQLQIIAGKNLEHKRQLLLTWYKQKAFDVFNERLTLLSSSLPWVKQALILRLRAMQARWGSCSCKGSIVLNTHLVKAPLACIDYVILHELCHMIEHNHSDKFYRLLAQVHPNWQQAKHYLDRRANLYLAD